MSLQLCQPQAQSSTTLIFPQENPWSRSLLNYLLKSHQHLCLYSRDKERWWVAEQKVNVLILGAWFSLILLMLVQTKSISPDGFASAKFLPWK